MLKYVQGDYKTWEVLKLEKFYSVYRDFVVQLAACMVQKYDTPSGYRFDMMKISLKDSFIRSLYLI